MPKETFDLVDVPLEVKERSRKYQWYWSFIYAAAWFLLYYLAVIPSFYSYPETLRVRNEHLHPDEFIGERANRQLVGLSGIGEKLAGTRENEVLAVNYLLGEIEKIRATARLDLYDIDVDVQYSSGDFTIYRKALSYRNVSNVIVKLSPKGSQSKSYLLVNSHYDSEVGSPAAADAGVMIVIMLETLRVISHSEKELKNPIVFLMNGAEEMNLLASHGFITQHPWAENCKALINLDSAGSGGREVLFQTGPNHPWLMKYYKQSARHPYATTLAEELFQNDFIPSDTDFRIFRDYGNIPGLDMAHTLNGYIYHTKYDNFFNMERGTAQTTGDNVLALTWALANAPELENPQDYAEGHTIFYDYLGWFMITYTESTGVIINILISCCALLAIGVSVFLMSRRQKQDSWTSVLWRFFLIQGAQILTVLAALGLVILVAVLMDLFGLSQSWYSAEWLTFGLYFCPIFFVIGLFQAIFIQWTSQRTNMALNDSIICFMHAHCVILVAICLFMTALGIRSAFFVVIAILFYTISTIFNIANMLWMKRDYFLVIHTACQILPYWFYTYLTFAFLKVFVPMQGRDGPTSKPEILVGGFIFIMALHFAGFILPIIQKFRKPKMFFSLLGVLTVIFIILAATPVGFPYKADVAPQRFYVLHTKRVIHNEQGYVTKLESGFYIQPEDTRPNTLKYEAPYRKAKPDTWFEENCAEEMFCGLPLYSTRWVDWNTAKWVPAGMPQLPIITDLKLVSKQHSTCDMKAQCTRYIFELQAADRVILFIEPLEDRKIIDWSFDRTPIEGNHRKPYIVYSLRSFVDKPLEFYIEVQRQREIPNQKDFKIAVTAHYQHDRPSYTKEYKEFLASFPDWAYTTDWIATYESWIF